jgi:hypothetical protein
MKLFKDSFDVFQNVPITAGILFVGAVAVFVGIAGVIPLDPTVMLDISQRISFCIFGLGLIAFDFYCLLKLIRPASQLETWKIEMKYYTEGESGEAWIKILEIIRRNFPVFLPYTLDSIKNTRDIVGRIFCYWKPDPGKKRASLMLDGYYRELVPFGDNRTIIAWGIRGHSVEKYENYEKLNHDGIEMCIEQIGLGDMLSFSTFLKMKNGRLLPEKTDVSYEGVRVTYIEEMDEILHNA